MVHFARGAPRPAELTTGLQSVSPTIPKDGQGSLPRQMRGRERMAITLLDRKSGPMGLARCRNSTHCGRGRRLTMRGHENQGGVRK